MSSDILSQSVKRRRRACLHRLIGQIMLDIATEFASRLVPAITLLVQTLHHDPIELPAQQGHQAFRFGLPDGG